MGVALPVLAIGASVVGTAISAYGAYSSGVAGKQTADYQAAVAQNNEIIAKQNSAYATEAGESKAQQQELSTRALIGSELAAQASSGVDVNSGSSVKVRSSAAALGTLSALNIRNNAAREAYGFQTQALNFEGEQALDKAKGQAAMSAGILGTVGALVSGAAKIGTQAVGFYRTGAGQDDGGGDSSSGPYHQVGAVGPPALAVMPNPPSIVR